MLLTKDFLHCLEIVRLCVPKPSVLAGFPSEEIASRHLAGCDTVYPAFQRGALPRVAAKLDVDQISDITEVKGEDTFVRPIYAGNAMCTLQSSDAVKVRMIRLFTFVVTLKFSIRQCVSASADKKAAMVHVQSFGSICCSHTFTAALCTTRFF